MFPYILASLALLHSPIGRITLRREVNLNNSSNPADTNSPQPSTKPPKEPGMEQWAAKASRQVIGNLNRARLLKEAKEGRKTK